ncbi:serine/threonine protein kinase [Geodermatophilus sp. DF01-2]|uniref:serine/threonine-protein kinase n=1 Tax=Geodermatophilus sp. DF01-2 TaxID=2559610 RepID=UPI00107421A2|nr:serine/threonine-protein kinase [Geodermatophilus sp. DF01_2]TFV57560.1 serine/threonine protein kinase [Geodermatophilus sp. DF01_2]
MALSTGTTLAGRYEITAPIATGGMGEVWRARDRVLDRVVAAKVLRSEFTGDPSFVARFRNEARHTAALSHPNIASVYDYGETEDERGAQLAFLVMELVEGKPLVTILHEEGRLPVDWTLHVLGQAADGLSAAHQAGVVHRDIKPGNLIVRPDGVVKLTDFGIARARDATPLTRTGMVVGTAQYLSPEQAQGFEVTAASDVYSLGVVGYECLTGVRPFDGESQVAVALAHINRPPPPLPADVPPAVRLLVERALAKDPADRFPDGAAFAASIRSVASGHGPAPAHPAAAPVASPPYPLGSSTARTEVVDGDLADSRTRVLGAASAAGAAATGACTSVGAMPPLRRPPQDDEDWGAPADDDDGRRRNRWVWLVAGLLVLALLGSGIWSLLGSGEDAPRTDAEPTTAAAPVPETFFVDSARYLGRDVDEAEEELQDAGLQVVTEEVDVTGLGRPVSEDEVVDVTPADQEVPLDGTVTLFYAPEDFTPGTDEDEEPVREEDEEVPAQETAPAPPRTTAPAPTTTRSTAPTTASTTTTTQSQPTEDTETPTPEPGTPAPEPEEPADPDTDAELPEEQVPEQPADAADAADAAGPTE